MGVQLARRVFKPAFGSRDTAAEMHQLADRAQLAGRRGDGPHQVRLRLERCITDARGHLCLHAAAHRRVEQRHRKAAVHHAERVVVLLARHAFEYHVPRLDFDQLKAEQLRYRWRGQAAIADGAQEFDSRHLLSFMKFTAAWITVSSSRMRRCPRASEVSIRAPGHWLVKLAPCFQGTTRSSRSWMTSARAVSRGASRARASSSQRTP